MFLKRRIISSSIAEVVIAMSVIALCIGIASLVFIRATRSSMNFQDVRKQTEIQSMIWGKLLMNGNNLDELNDVQMNVQEDAANDSLEVYRFTGNETDEIWIQQWVKHD